MTKTGKRLAAVLMAVAMIVAFVPVLGTQTACAADDTRTEITQIIATSNIITPVYGEAIPDPVISVETGSPAWFQGATWYKKTEDDWEVVNGGTFTSGTYQCAAIIRISDGGTEYKLGWPISVIVDGVEWTTGWDGPEVFDTWSRLGIGSPEYVVTAPVDAPLVFMDKSVYDIGTTYIGQAISEFSVASSAEGGKTPYAFSKTSGPSWISVSGDGIVSGTPTVTGSNDDLVVRVTDANGDYAEISIDVAATVMDPAARTEITEIIASSNIVTPVYGDAIPDPVISVETGSPAWFQGAAWYKKTEDNWEVVNGGTFTSGTYQCTAIIRISDGGTEYKLGWPISVIVDGVEWTTGWDGPEVFDTWSRLGIGSPEYVVNQPIAVPSGKTLTYTGKSQTGVDVGTGYTVTGTKNASNAGTYKATVTPNEGFCWEDSTTEAKTVSWKINKAANPLTMKAKTATVKYSKLKKKNQTLAVTKVIKFTKKGQGTMTYTKASGNKKITINKKTGKVTVKKGLKKGTYKVKVKVKAAGNANYNASAVKTVTFKVKVK